MQEQSSFSRRRRGAPPGNQNARGNRGNPHARGVMGNRGGRGAPRGNQFARKTCSPHQDLLVRYGHDAELAAWIRAHATELDEADFTVDEKRDRAYYQMGAAGLSFDDILAEHGV